MRVIHVNDTTAFPPKPCVATVGFFDGVHLGHQHLIAQVAEIARQRGLETTVVTFDRHPRQVVDTSFMPELLTTCEEKTVLLAKTAIDCCAVLHFTPAMAALTAREFMEHVLRDRLGVKVLVTGYDNRFGCGRAEGFDDYVRHGASMGMEVMLGTPLAIGGLTVSSSVIRRQLHEGDVETAARCLGRDYALTGRVVKGRQQGRQLGFPTANIDVDDAAKVLPAPGVYTTRVRVEGSMEMKRAVMNIGSHPTFDDGTQSVEAHIINFEGDLYGLRVVATLSHRLREEHRFASTGLLVAQMRKDVKAANEWFDSEVDSSSETSDR